MKFQNNVYNVSTAKKPKENNSKKKRSQPLIAALEEVLKIQA